MSKSLNKFRQQSLPELFPVDKISRDVDVVGDDKIHNSTVTKEIDNEKSDKDHRHDDDYAPLSDFNTLKSDVKVIGDEVKTTMYRNPGNITLPRTTRLTIVRYLVSDNRTLTLGNGFKSGDMIHIYRDNEQSGTFTLNALREISVVLNGNTLKENSHNWEGKSTAILVFDDNEWLLSLS